MQKPSFKIQLPCNPNNPYDWFGQVHNYQVSYLFKNFAAQWQHVKDIKAREALIRSNTADTMKKFYGISVDLSFLDKVPGNKGLFSQIDFSKYKTFFSAINNLPTSDANAIIAFLDIFTALPIETDIQVSNALLHATELENDFLTDDSHLTNQNVLGAMAIAKHSLYLIHTTLPTPPSIHINWGTVIADVAGGVVGGIVGNVLGALTGAEAASSIYSSCVS